MKNIILSTALYISLTSCSFSQTQRSDFDVVTIPVGKGDASVEIADFNKDGKPDIVVAHMADNDKAVAGIENSSITILLNTGKRKFAPSTGSPFYAGNFPNDINTADFNKDGNLDIALANHQMKYFTLLLGNGKGQFSQAPHSPFAIQVKPHTHGIVSADFNNDGNLDIATDSWAVDSIVTVNGDGKGNFTNPVYFATGKHPYQGLRTADFNNDGNADIVTTNLESGNVSILSGDGKGDFTQHLFDAGTTPFGVAIGDFNHDKNQDLAVINSPGLEDASSGKDGLTVLLNDGKGNFTSMKGSPFETGTGPSRVATEDLNNDGFDDIAVTDYKSGDFMIYYMNKNGLLATSKQKIGNYSDGIAIDDMDGDSKKDIIVTSYADNTVSIFFNK